ncbi:hypothetical protein [Bosea sp. NBC_00550]|uniref:hypothetical protein n=1 Tax=Bosea sp. NBC_00550 TaxID=2969621 RepID=UPI00222E96F3|nr:hypothetical protein [Bosea sp. NBC_00550]UZF94400.1 hypothetical protein NWE53_09565 [Bosea sp. NBC_00550]
MIAPLLLAVYYMAPAPTAVTILLFVLLIAFYFPANFMLVLRRMRDVEMPLWHGGLMIVAGIASSILEQMGDRSALLSLPCLIYLLVMGLILLFKPGLAAQQAKAIKAAPVRPRGEPAP